MAAGVYTSPKRVVKNGILIAFKGEQMSQDEAIKRGLTKGTDAVTKASDETSKKPSTATKSKTGTKSAPEKPEIGKTPVDPEGSSNPGNGTDGSDDSASTDAVTEASDE